MFLLPGIHPLVVLVFGGPKGRRVGLSVNRALWRYVGSGGGGGDGDVSLHESFLNIILLLLLPAAAVTCCSCCSCCCDVILVAW